MTVGIALHIAATKTIQIASLGESPNATTAAPFAHVEYVTRSENQYKTKVTPFQVLLCSSQCSLPFLTQNIDVPFNRNRVLVYWTSAHFIHKYCVGRRTCVTPYVVGSQRALLLWEFPTEGPDWVVSFLKHIEFVVIPVTAGKVVKYEKRVENLGYRYVGQYVGGRTFINCNRGRKIPCPPMNILNRLESECGDGRPPMSSIRLH